jgi:hypothetical protein
MIRRRLPAPQKRKTPPWHEPRRRFEMQMIGREGSRRIPQGANFDLRLAGLAATYFPAS